MRPGERPWAWGSRSPCAHGQPLTPESHRARIAGDPTDREIEEARLAYWALIERRALARGVNVSQVVTEQAQHVDADGNVHIGGLLAGRTTPDRPGWAAWGLEAAGPPWSPPPSGKSVTIL